MNKNEEPKLMSTITPMLTEVRSFAIKNSDEMGKATKYLSEANKILDNLTEDKEKLTKPLNEALKAIRAKYKPAEIALEEIITSIRKSMTSYQTTQKKLENEAQAKIADKVASGKISIDKAIQKLESLEVVANKTVTDEGSISFRPTPTLKISDPLAIPREYLIIDETSLLKALKSGAQVPGAEIEIIQVPINRRA